MKRLARDESGQALAIGVLLLVLLALGMYMVATFGQHVKEKQHVQTTADAMALSLATMEAQSFNYIAFANRAQVAHYVTLMNLQGYVSFLSSMEHLMLSTSGMCNAAAKACSTVGILVCGELASMFEACAQTTFTAYTGLKTTIKAADFTFGSQIAGRLEDLNRALWVTEMIMMYVVDAHLGSGGYEVFKTITQDNDPAWSATAAGLTINQIFAVRNHFAYANAFDAVGGAPFSGTKLDPGAHDSADQDIQRAQRIMTEIVNATRYDRTLTTRPIPFTDKIGIAPIIDQIRRLTNVPVIGPLIAEFFGRFGGESKLVDRTDLETIFRSNQNDSKLNRGSVMASKDEWLWGRGSVWVKAGSTGQAQFEHCRANQDYTSAPLLPGIGLGKCVTSSTDDPNHAYRGITPFMLYNAGFDKQPNKSGEAFRQPDVYVWLHKSMEQAQFKQTIAFSWNTNKGSAGIDTTIGRSAGALGAIGIPGADTLRGVHAFARAQAYYHRPGNWEEPPNLFNPFWRARLAPIIDSRDPGGNDELLSNLGAFAAGNFIFH